MVKLNERQQQRLKELGFKGSIENSLKDNGFYLILQKTKTPFTVSKVKFDTGMYAMAINHFIGIV